MATPEEFTLLPLTLPSDAPSILRLHYQVYLSDSLHSSTNPQSESSFISSGLCSIIAHFSKSNALGAKLVLSSNPSRLVSYVVWYGPGEEDSRSEEEKDRDVRKGVEEMSDGLDKELVYRLKTEGRVLSERFLGKGYRSKWWELEALVTDEEYQRRGLGSRLVNWGLGRVEEDVKARRERGEREVEGAYLVASPQGARTYEKAGFVKVGEKMVEKEGVEGYEHAWYVKRFE